MKNIDVKLCLHVQSINEQTINHFHQLISSIYIFNSTSIYHIYQYAYAIMSFE